MIKSTIARGVFSALRDQEPGEVLPGCQRLSRNELIRSDDLADQITAGRERLRQIEQTTPRPCARRPP